MDNPLLTPSDLPPFDRIGAQDVAPAIDGRREPPSQALETAPAPGFPARWQAIMEQWEVPNEQLLRAWGAISHLNSVADPPPLRAAYNAALPRITEFWTRLGTNERLYAKYKAIDPASLTPVQSQAHRNAMRNFVLAGAE